MTVVDRHGLCYCVHICYCVLLYNCNSSSLLTQMHFAWNTWRQTWTVLLCYWVQLFSVFYYVTMENTVALQLPGRVCWHIFIFLVTAADRRGPDPKWVNAGQSCINEGNVLTDDEELHSKINLFPTPRIRICNILNLFLICLKVAAVAANCESNVRIRLTGH